MEIAIGGGIGEERGDRLVVPVLSDLTWGPGAGEVRDALDGRVETFLEAVDFEGKRGQVAVLPVADELPYGDVMFLGLGDEVDAEALRRAAGTAASRSGRSRTVATTLHRIDIDGAVEAVAVGYLLGSYSFDRYRSDPKPRRNERLVLLDAGAVDDEIAAGRMIAEGVALARDLVNEPAVAKPPEALAEIARGLSGSVQVDVYDEAACVEMGFGGLLAVAAGSARAPRMVVMRYEPDGATASLGLVGKGIVFDSGGLSLKPAKSMEEMKTDMAGAAAVFGAVKVIASLGLPVRVVAVTPITENMPGGGAIRPGDVLTAYNGKTIEVLNTDAEGRLVLADGLAYVAETEPDLIVDVATLTGACKVALGPKIAGVLGNDDDAIERVVTAARTAGESVWQLPLEREYRKMIDSAIADMKNTGERWGGAITAALLLDEFVGERPWVHLDIAGPARAASEEHYITKGGTGFGVRTIVELARSLAS